MEVEIQLPRGPPVRDPPDSSIFSLILVGWCEKGHPATKKLASTLPGIDSCL